jgi:hypothetical protein
MCLSFFLFPKKEDIKEPNEKNAGSQEREIFDKTHITNS